MKVSNADFIKPIKINLKIIFYETKITSSFCYSFFFE